MRPRFGWLPFLLPLLASLVVLVLIPPEKTLGNLIRLIYFHGAWIWTGILLCVISAACGLLAILLRKPIFHENSAAFARVGLIFLLLYLPMALLVMKLSWGGFFLAEPRWSIPFSLTIADLLVQLGVPFIKIPTVSSLANLGIGTILVYNISKIQSVLHPEAPIQASGSINNQILFYLLIISLLIFGIVLSRVFIPPVNGENMTLLLNASQVLTLAGGPQRGSDLGNLKIIEGGAVFFQNEQIIEVGTSSDLLRNHPNEPVLDAGGRVVMPGFVDPHTHLVWAGDRSAEFEMRLQGKTYMEILASGGGIISTVKATRNASAEKLLQQTQERAQSLFQHGTTTAEIKTGYGLSASTEIAQLQTILSLNQQCPLQAIPTFLGAHAIAPEYKDQPDEYTHLLVEEMLPEIRTWWSENGKGYPLPFVDVFCEIGAFTLEQTRQILERAKELGFPLKIHVDEFENLGGASLAAELGATSADHLVKTSADDILRLAQSDTVAVSLPCTPFGLADPHYTPAREILAAGGLLALATDCNPGTAWCESMQFVIALACRALKLTPAQAIAASTINAAAAIGMQDQIGSLENGKQADILILTVNDYRHLGYRFGTNLVSQIIKKGKVYTNPSWN